MLVNELYQKYREKLQLSASLSALEMNRTIVLPEVQRPGLSLAGHMPESRKKRIMIFGRGELEYLKSLTEKERTTRIKTILAPTIPAVIVTRNYRPLKELEILCKRLEIPLVRSKMKSMELVSQLTVILSDELAPRTSLPGTLVEVYGLGVFLMGDSAVGKSEAALGLIERGHRLVSDDVVKIKKRENSYLEGTSPDLSRHHLEIRGIGIVNVAHLFGAFAMTMRSHIDVIIELKHWDEDFYYDRLGLDDQTFEILDLKIPHYVLPVKMGRDIVLLIETTLLNHRLKEMGYHSAKELNEKLLQQIMQKTEGRKHEVSKGRHSQKPLWTARETSN